MRNLTVVPHRIYKSLYAILDNYIYWGIEDIGDRFDLEVSVVRNFLKQFDHTIVNMDIIFFKNKEDAETVIEWINTLDLARKLS